MNRLFLIGNGFDLAHGLPTGYMDFLNDYLSNLIENTKDKTAATIIKPGGERHSSKSLDDDNISISINCDLMGSIPEKSDYNPLDFLQKEYVEYKPKNNFLGHLIERISIQNWVDVEEEYYNKLKRHALLDMRDDQKVSRVKKLNQDFTKLKQLFEKYLEEKVEPLIYDCDLLFEQFFSTLGTRKEGKNALSPKDLILNFNYTSLMKGYLESGLEFNYDLVNIHGSLHSKSNPIIFGYGDEEGDDYRTIENLNKPEYLDHSKSFMYLMNDNYQRLVSFVEFEEFEVWVIGMSCGLSDRVMLKYIFESEFCKKIHVMYHEGKENFTRITQNISRHFSDKQVFRNKVLPFDPSDKCPQSPRIQAS